MCKWVTQKEDIVVRGMNKKVQKTTKTTFKCTIGDLVDEMEKTIMKYMKHCGRIKKQFKAIREKKENLEDDEIIIHIDFSENFSGKFAEEIQSVHFGSSRSLITLHTGVFYVKNENPVSFCTITECKDHGPYGPYGLT